MLNAENITISYDLALKLKEAGCTAVSYFSFYDKDCEIVITDRHKDWDSFTDSKEFTPAYTMHELMALIHKSAVALITTGTDDFLVDVNDSKKGGEMVAKTDICDFLGEILLRDLLECWM